MSWSFMTVKRGWPVLPVDSPRKSDLGLYEILLRPIYFVGLTTTTEWYVVVMTDFCDVPLTLQKGVVPHDGERYSDHFRSWKHGRSVLRQDIVLPSFKFEAFTVREAFFTAIVFQAWNSKSITDFKLSWKRQTTFPFHQWFKKCNANRHMWREADL